MVTHPSQGSRHKIDVVLFAQDLEVVDRVFVLDNSGRRYRLLLSMERGQVKRVSRNLPAWARNALPSDIQRSRDMEG